LIRSAARYLHQSVQRKGELGVDEREVSGVENPLPASLASRRRDFSAVTPTDGFHQKFN